MTTSAPTTVEAVAWQYKTSGYPKCLYKGKAHLPTQPTSGKEILISNYAAALNPVDIQLMNVPLWGLPIPVGPFNSTKGVGEDFAGVVLAAGAETDFKPGDKVFGLMFAPGGPQGTLQDILSVDTASSVVCHKPDAWSWEQAASLPLVWLTARTCIESVIPALKAAKKGGKIVILGGSSSTGMYTVQIAKRMGWKVLATCSGRNTDFVKSMGADEVCDYTKSNVPNEVKRYAPDAIVDCVGGTECLNLAERYVTIVGDKTSRSQMGGAATYLWNPQMLLRWALGRLGLGVQYDCVNLFLRKEFLEEAFQLQTSQIAIDSTFSLDEAPKAFERLNTGRARGKVCIKIDH